MKSKYSNIAFLLLLWPFFSLSKEDVTQVQAFQVVALELEYCDSLIEYIDKDNILKNLITDDDRKHYLSSSQQLKTNLELVMPRDDVVKVFAAGVWFSMERIKDKKKSLNLLGKLERSKEALSELNGCRRAWKFLKEKGLI